MKYKAGQKVVINKNAEQWSLACKLFPQNVATIIGFEADPHTGMHMYRFEELPWGWYEYEIEGLYVPEEPVKDRFEIMDL